MKFKLLNQANLMVICIMSCLSWTPVTFSAEFIFLDLLGNTLPSAKCQTEESARTRASSEYELSRYAKVFCETQGYGWYVEQRKSDGKTACEECKTAPGKHQCHVEDIHVTCKRLKPGSAGLFPGEG